MRHRQCVCVFTVFVLVLLFSSVDGSQKEPSFGGMLHLSFMPSSAEEASGEYGFFNGLSSRESSPAWEYFVPGWRQNFQGRYRLWNNAEPSGFAFEMTCIPADIRAREILTPPFSVGDVRLQITEESLALLGNTGIPEEVIILMLRLKEQVFEDEALFATALLHAIGEENLEEYLDVILQHSYVDSTLNSPVTLRYLRKLDEQNRSRQLQIWDDSLLSDKDKSKYLFREKELVKTSKNASSSEKNLMVSWLHELRAFCVKWGLPRPRTLLLLLILFYLTVSLIKNFVRVHQ